jgi:hypothetical protein
MCFSNDIILHSPYVIRSTFNLLLHEQVREFVNGHLTQRL